MAVWRQSVLLLCLFAHPCVGLGEGGGAEPDDGGVGVVAFSITFALLLVPILLWIRRITKRVDIARREVERLSSLLATAQKQLGDERSGLLASDEEVARFRSALSEKEDELERKGDQLEKLARECKAKDSKIQHQEDELQKLGKKNSKLKNEVKLLETTWGTLDELQNDIDDLRGGDAMVQGVSKELDHVKDELARAQDELIQSQDDLARSKDELARSKDELARSQDELARAQDELAQSQDDLARSQDELARSQDKLDSLMVELAQERSRIEELEGVQGELSRVQHELERSDLEVKKAQSLNDELSTKLSDANSTEKESMETIEMLRHDLCVSLSDASSVREAMQRNGQHLDDEVARRKRLECDLSERLDELRDAIAASKSLEDRLSCLSSSMALADEAHSSQLARAKEETSALEERWSNRLEAEQRESDALRSDLSSALSDLTELRRLFDEQCVELNRRASEIAQKEHQAVEGEKNRERSAAKLQRKIKTIAFELVTCKDEVAQLTQRSESLQTELLASHSELEKCKRDLSEANDALASTQARCIHLANQLEHVERATSSLSSLELPTCGDAIAEKEGKCGEATPLEGENVASPSQDENVALKEHIAELQSSLSLHEEEILRMRSLLQDALPLLLDRDDSGCIDDDDGGGGGGGGGGDVVDDTGDDDDGGGGDGANIAHVHYREELSRKDGEITYLENVLHEKECALSSMEEDIAELRALIVSTQSLSTQLQSQLKLVKGPSDAPSETMGEARDDPKPTVKPFTGARQRSRNIVALTDSKRLSGQITSAFSKMYDILNDETQDARGLGTPLRGDDAGDGTAVPSSSNTIGGEAVSLDASNVARILKMKPPARMAPTITLEESTLHHLHEERMLRRSRGESSCYVDVDEIESLSAMAEPPSDGSVSITKIFQEEAVRGGSVDSTPPAILEEEPHHKHDVRSRVILELIDTERTYLEKLVVFHGFFIIPLMQLIKAGGGKVDGGSAILSMEDFDVIFGNWEDLIALSANFRTEFEKRAQAHAKTGPIDDGGGCSDGHEDVVIGAPVHLHSPRKRKVVGFAGPNSPPHQDNSDGSVVAEDRLIRSPRKKQVVYTAHEDLLRLLVDTPAQFSESYAMYIMNYQKALQRLRKLTMGNASFVELLLTHINWAELTGNPAFASFKGMHRPAQKKHEPPGGANVMVGKHRSKRAQAPSNTIMMSASMRARKLPMLKSLGASGAGDTADKKHRSHVERNIFFILTTFLVLPIQRMPRYLLMVRELLKNTPPEEGVRQELLSRAVALFEGMLESTEHRTRRHTICEALKWHIVNAGDMEREGLDFLQFRNEGWFVHRKKHSIVLLLFDAMLLVVQPTRREKGSKRKKMLTDKQTVSPTLLSSENSMVQRAQGSMEALYFVRLPLLELVDVGPGTFTITSRVKAEVDKTCKLVGEEGSVARWVHLLQQAKSECIAQVKRRVVGAV